MKQNYSTSKAPQVLLQHISGPLSIRGTGELKVVIDSVSPQVQHDVEADKLTIIAHAPTNLWLPEQAHLIAQTIHGPTDIKGIINDVEINGQIMGPTNIRRAGRVKVQEVMGDLNIKEAREAVEIGTTHGDTVLRNVKEGNVSQVHGDMSARNIEGAFTIQFASGDINLRTIGGNVTIEHAGRDVNMRNISGILEIKQADGDIRLKDSLCAGKHHIQADGDVVIRWPANSPLNLDVTAARIRCDLDLDKKLEEKSEDGRKILNGRWEDGETTLVVDCKGEFILKISEGEETADDDNLGIDVDFVLEMENWGEKMAQIGERIASEVNRRLGDRMGEIEKIVKRVQNRMPTPPTPPTPPNPPHRPAAPHAPHTPHVPPTPKSAETKSAAQMKVLEMLEKGTISVEEANTLLKALE